MHTMSLRTELFSVKGVTVEDTDGHFSHSSLISPEPSRAEPHLRSEEGPNPKEFQWVWREGGFHGTQRLPDASTVSSHTESLAQAHWPHIPPYLATRPPALFPPTNAAPLARASHTPLCDVVSRHRVMWGTGSVVVGAGQALLGGVKTYLWCHLSCSDK